MNIFRIKIRKRWTNYLKKLEKINKELYGDGRLECCDLNKKYELK